MLITYIGYTHGMSKRLQVILSDDEYEELRLVSSSAGVTVSEWVRQALRRVRRDQSLLETDGKIEAVRSAAKHEFPTADIDTMLGEIEDGYLR
jgi:hypothetical protein